MSSLKNLTGSIERDSLLAIGIVRKPHGVRGEASIEPWTENPARFQELERVLLVSPDGDEILEATIDTIRFHGPRVLLSFVGVDSPEAVRAYQHWSVEIPEADRLPTDEDEYYLYELEGLRMIDPEGAEIGTVEVAIEGGGGVLLTVRSASGQQFDVPLVKAICTSVDIEKGTIVADLPEGLVDLDEAPIGDRREERRREGTLHDPLPKEPAPEIEPREHPELRIDVMTIFPPMFDAIRNEGVIARALKENILELKVWDLRDFTTDRHRSTDDEAYGGGAGMVMIAEPFFRCYDSIRADRPGETPRVILMSPQGRRFTNDVARELSAGSWLVLLCGRYEGIDERVRETIVDEEISIGDYVLSGGELAAMVVVDAVGRMVEDVVGDRNSVEADSFYNGLLDHPHYTRPADIRGLKVPDVLISGHAERIREWRKREAIRATLDKRPDLIESAELDDEGRRMLESLREEKQRGR